MSLTKSRRLVGFLFIQMLIALPGCVTQQTTVPLSVHSAMRIDAGFRASAKDFYAVYQQAQADRPKLAGQVVFSLQVSAAGAVESVTVAHASMNEPDFLTSLLKVAEAMRFDPVNYGVWQGTYRMEFLPE